MTCHQYRQVMQSPERNVTAHDHPWCNSYNHLAHATISADERYGPTPYDVNFCLPYNLKFLETDQIKLVPFIPRLHAEGFFLHALSYPEDFRLMHYSPPKSLSDVLEFFELKYRRNPGNMAFVVVDKQSGTAGGIVTLSSCDAVNLRASISMGIAYRTHTAGSTALRSPPRCFFVTA